MRGKIQINYKNGEVKYHIISQMYWCLWDERFCQLFKNIIVDYIDDITDALIHTLGCDWNDWDFCDIDFDIAKYCM